MARRAACRLGPARRVAALLASSLLAAGSLAGCEQLTALTGAGPVEAWQADVPARFTFPPVGLEEFVMERKEAGSLELVLRIGADGALERLGAERVEGLDPDALEQLYATMRRARFAPAQVGGRQVASIKRVALEFDPLASFAVTAQAPDRGR